MPNPPFDRLRVVLVRTSLPANIGAAARAMLTMGLARLVLVAPRSFPHADATALAAGATSVLDAARVVATLDDALAGASFS
ncbi:MAG TPA: TrmH family RNA methyltransferase, partial [Casimicrobiaceae bacterium]|nr:TrmH family RNA methyltransferase [Casimicrobiaceae bacterium]